MIFKRYLFLLVGLIGIAGLQAQNSPQVIVDAYEAAGWELVLLRNQNELIPLRRLDTLRIGFYPVGMGSETAMLDMLQRYTTVELVKPPLEDPSAREDWLDGLDSRYNLIILGVADSLPGGRRPDLEAHSADLQAISTRVRTAAIVIGNGTSLEVLPSLSRSNALLFSPLNPFAIELAPQLVFGAIRAKGKLTRDLSDDFLLGDGMGSLGGMRLRYGPPELAGMDAEYLRDSLRSIVKEGIDKGAFPGAQVIVAKDGIVVFREAFGFHTFDKKREVRLDDLYDYASMTKITGALPALIKLYGRGEFLLDKPLAYYWPDAIGTNKANLSFRLMLAHNARLRPWIPYWQGTLRGNARYPWDKKWNNTAINEGKFRSYTIKKDSSRRFPIHLTEDLWLHRKFKEKKIYKAIEESPLLEESGYVYSGLLFYLLPDIVSDITGRDYLEYLDNEFYHRLGANTITYNPMEKFPRDRMVPTERDTFFRMELLQGVVHDEGAAVMDGVSSNAGLFSTADDLAKLMQMYLNFGHFGGEQLITRTAMEEFTSYQYADQGVRRGLGFDKPMLEYDPAVSYVAKSASPSSFGHSGYTGTFAWADPDTGLLFILFSNRVYPTRDNRKLYTLSIRPRLHQACYDAILDGDPVGH